MFHGRHHLLSWYSKHLRAHTICSFCVRRPSVQTASPERHQKHLAHSAARPSPADTQLIRNHFEAGSTGGQRVTGSSESIVGGDTPHTSRCTGQGQSDGALGRHQNPHVAMGREADQAWPPSARRPGAPECRPAPDGHPAAHARTAGGARTFSGVARIWPAPVW